MSGYSSEIKELSEKLERLLGEMPREKEHTSFKTVFREFTFGFFEEYAQWKYEHPILSGILRVFRFLVFSFFLFAFAWWLAGTSAGRVIGLDGVRDRTIFAYYSIVWASKGMPDVDSLQLAPKRFSGTIEKIVGDVLIVSYYDQGKSIRRLVRPANVMITDKRGFGEWANKYLLKGVTVDFYVPIDKASGYDVWGVVLWSKRIPINVQLVELGYGTPEYNPETQVVNSIFSRYYLQRAKSG